MHSFSISGIPPCVFITDGKKNDASLGVCIQDFAKRTGSRMNAGFDERPTFGEQTFPINSRYFNLSHQSSIPKLPPKRGWQKIQFWNCNDRKFHSLGARIKWECALSYDRRPVSDFAERRGASIRIEKYAALSRIFRGTLRTFYRPYLSMVHRRSLLSARKLSRSSRIDLPFITLGDRSFTVKYAANFCLFTQE